MNDQALAERLRSLANLAMTKVVKGYRPASVAWEDLHSVAVLTMLDQTRRAEAKGQPTDCFILLKAARRAIFQEIHKGARQVNAETDHYGTDTDVRAFPPEVAADDDQAMAKTMLYDLLDHLTDEERAVICLRYGLEEHPPHTLEDLGEALGISPMTALRRVNEILDKLSRIGNKEEPDET